MYTPKGKPSTLRKRDQNKSIKGLKNYSRTALDIFFNFIIFYFVFTNNHIVISI